MTIREAKINDAERLLVLNRLLDRETEFMLFEPDERTTTLRQQREQLAALAGSDAAALFIADEGDDLIGFAVGDARGPSRTRGTARVVIGVARDSWGQRVGYALLETVEVWARDHEVRRLELTVLVHNERAIKLYRRAGFEEEGVRRMSVQVGGLYRDELYMAKILLGP